MHVNDSKSFSKHIIFNLSLSKNKVLDFSSQNLNQPSTNFASNITKCIILDGSDLCPVASGHWSRVQSWTRVRIATCPVALATGHKLYPSWMATLDSHTIPCTKLSKE